MESNFKNIQPYPSKFIGYIVVGELILYENLLFSFIKLINFSNLYVFSKISPITVIFS